MRKWSRTFKLQRTQGSNWLRKPAFQRHWKHMQNWYKAKLLQGWRIVEEPCVTHLGGRLVMIHCVVSKTKGWKPVKELVRRMTSAKN